MFVFATATVPAETRENFTIKWMGKEVVVSDITADMAVEWIYEAGFEVVRAAESSSMPKGVEAGICKDDEVEEEDHVFVYAQKA